MPDTATDKSSQTAVENTAVTRWILLAFDRRNRLLLAEDGTLSRLQPCPPTPPDQLLETAVTPALETIPAAGKPRYMTTLEIENGGQRHSCALFFLRSDAELPYGGTALTLQEVYRRAETGELPDWLGQAAPALPCFSGDIPYLDFRAHDFVYKFRSESQRNRDVYRADPHSQALYQSQLCEAIKATRRTKENASDRPARLAFGPVTYYLPSHFGFCLGVQNAIERAYETLAENPGQQVYMLSELIHNPFVNEDLKARGLRFLQTDKGEPLPDPETGQPLWDLLQPEDIVIIPAFGATLEDKRRLIERGLEINRFDATCMLVEKVWKAAKRYGEAGFTIVIHGKREHEETKATFSSSARYGPCLVIRNQDEAQRLADIIRTGNPDAQRQLFAGLGLQSTPGFDPPRDLQKMAVVNQTTLLRNETLRIIGLLEEAIANRWGPEAVAERLNGKSRGDTLCYATQVNQDALTRTLEEPVDLALVAGGKNSSNTFQLYRICRQHFGARAFYIQSEQNIQAPDRILHYHFPYEPDDPKAGTLEPRPFLDAAPKPPGEPVHILLTGGASCPDGIIQQIITRINGFFPSSELRPLDEIIREVEES